MPARRFRVTVFLGLAIVAAQTFGQAPAAAQQLILTRASLGPLPLEEGMVVSLANVRSLFPSFDVTQSIGGGESGDYPVIRVGAAGARLFSIVGVSGSSETASEFPVAYLVVESPQIADEHGIRVGDTYRDVVTRRGSQLRFGAAHHDIFAGDDQIYYTIAMPAPAANEPDRSPESVTPEEVLAGAWRISRISWPAWVW